MKNSMWRRGRLSQARHPADLLTLWIITLLTVAVATAVQWHYWAMQLGAGDLPPLDRIIFIWELAAILMISFLPVLLIASGLTAAGWRRTAWGLFIVGQLLIWCTLAEDLQVYHISGHHLPFYIQFLFQPQEAIVAGGISIMLQQIGLLVGMICILFFSIVLIVNLLVRFIRPRWHLSRPRRLLYIPPAAYVLVILGIVAVQKQVQSFGPLTDFLAALPFNLCRFGLGPTPPDRGPFERELTLALGRQCPRWKTAFSTSPPVDTSARITCKDPPNVIILIADSLRRDMFNPTYMPRFYAHAQKGLVLADHHPGVNGTQMAMFSLTYGRYAMFITPTLNAGVKPQLPAIFNQSGYHTTYMQGYDDSHFFRMWEYVGPGSGFNNTTLKIHGDQWDVADQDILNTIQRMVAKPKKPQMILALLSSTHFPYFYPPEFKKYKPALDPRTCSAVRLNPQKDRTPLFNDYKNSVAYMDYLLGNFLNHIDLKKNLVLILGDHGESFWEDGHFTHAGPMSRIVMNVPCAFIGAGVPRRQITAPTQHVDLLPTLLHLVQGSPVPVKNLQGEDLLDQSTPRPGLLACNRYASTDNNITFLVLDSTEAMQLRWIDSKQRLVYEGKVNRKGRLRPFRIPPVANADQWAARMTPLLKLCEPSNQKLTLGHPTAGARDRNN